MTLDVALSLQAPQSRIRSKRPDPTVHTTGNGASRLTGVITVAPLQGTTRRMLNSHRVCFESLVSIRLDPRTRCFWAIGQSVSTEVVKAIGNRTSTQQDPNRWKSRLQDKVRAQGLHPRPRKAAGKRRPARGTGESQSSNLASCCSHPVPSCRKPQPSSSSPS